MLSSGFSLLVLMVVRTECRLPEAFTVAAIFDQDTDLTLDLMFVNAIKKVNRIPGFLPPGLALVPLIQRIPRDNSFLAERATCQVLSKGVVAVFGPQSKINSEHVKSICDCSEIPYFETSLGLPGTSQNPHKKTTYGSVSLFPDFRSIGKILVDLMIRYGWTKVTLLYDTNLNLKLLQPILQHTAAASSGFIINLKQLKPEEDEDYRGVLKEIVANEGENIVLSCDLEILFTVLNQAQQIGIVTGKQNWILTNLDAHTADLSPFKYDYTNFTLFRLIDPGNPFVYRILGEIVEEEIRMGRSLDFVDFSGGLKLDAALIYDGVHLLAAALGQLSNVQELQLQSLSCEDSSTQFWKHGSSIVNYMRATILPGITGPIRFDSYGQRTDFQLEVLQLLEEHGVVKVGNWVEGDGFNITGYHLESKPEPSTINPMFNKSLTVTTIFNDPYTMLKEDTKLLVGNERYEGFIPDMVHILSTILQFNYTLRIVEDGQYGSYDANTGRWNGMIGEVLTGEADMVVADLSITTSRAAAVEFSMPWMNLGISIIYQKPKKAAPSLLSFMLPFSDGVWIAMLAAFILVAFLTFFIGRFSPNEWFNPNFCILEPKEVETQWTFCNSVWHTVGALMQQGTEFCPVALSTRFLVGVFYFFTLIIVSSYTANLAASLTAEMLERPIENAEDLAKQTEIKYGVVYCGSTCNFFKTSTFNTYSTMWKFMSDNKDEVMVGSNKEGVEKVEAGGYAFMMEDAGIQYIVERRCSLAQIGGNLDTKGYGIATRPGSGFKDLLDSAILKMQENGDFHKLKNKWWKQKRGGGQCLQSASASVTKLDLANLGGIFLVTLLGCGLAGLVCILELIWGCYQDSQEFGTPWGFEIKQRIEFAYRCSSFGRKGRMASMRYKNESRMTSEGLSESSIDEPPKTGGVKRRNSYHIHYPGW